MDTGLEDGEENSCTVEMFFGYFLFLKKCNAVENLKTHVPLACLDDR